MRVRASTPPARRRRTLPAWGRVVLGSLVIVAAGWTVRPAASLAASHSGLIRVHPGLFTRVARARVITPAGAIPVTDRQGTLWPLRPLRPGRPVELQITLESPVPGWPAMTQEVRVTPPAAPALARRREEIAVGRPVSVPLRSPAAGVRTGHLLATRLNGTQWQLAPRPSTPATRGRLRIWTRARRYEAWARAGTITWRTPGFLTLTAGPSSPTGLLIHFSAPVRVPSHPRWVLSDPGGAWLQVGSNGARFIPSVPLWPGQSVSLTIRGGPVGVRSLAGSWVQNTVRLVWTVPQGSVTRAQELLAELGYLPLTWTPARGSGPLTLRAAQIAIEDPPTGTFHWRWPRIPSDLKALWTPGTDGAMTKGAVMQFEADHGLPVDGIIGPQVWQALVMAVLRHQVNTGGYAWIYVSETLPETFTLWRDGQVVLTSLTNTGIPASPTALGTFPIYLRYRSQTMTGTNPNGTHYSDPGVPWVNYFSGGDAVHGFVRATYGFPQSLGCVELPPSTAGKVWALIHYGTLVTVRPPGSSRSPS
jgi:hypothetical protein